LIIDGEFCQIKGGRLKMNSFTSRTAVLAVVVASVLLPLYAHHGNQFLSKAMEMNTAEVQMGELALKKSQNAQVKDFAQMMVRDHNQALDRLREIRDARMASSLSKGQTTPSTAKATAANVQLTPEHQRMSERLAMLSGADFDREYMDMMVREHRKAISDFEAEARVHGNATTRNQTTDTTQQTTRQKPAPDQRTYSTEELNRDMDLSDFAAASLPTLRRHLEEAERIQRELPKR
jgi:predicted outer membrane protein